MFNTFSVFTINSYFEQSTKDIENGKYFLNIYTFYHKSSIFLYKFTHNLFLIKNLAPPKFGEQKPYSPKHRVGPGKC